MSSKERQMSGFGTHEFSPGWDVPRLKKLLYAALSRLAAHGWIVLPDDATDLLHDFLVRFFERTLPRFDAGRGSFAQYVTQEFQWFAKSWLLNQRRWRDKREDLEVAALFAGSALATDKAADSASDIAATAEIINRIQVALAHLPSLTQEILLRYLSNNGGRKTSERALVAETGLTRHTIRNHLINGFGKILVAFERPADVSELEWAILTHLYQDGLTATEVARLLGWPAADVQAVRQRLLSRLGQHPSAHRPSSSVRPTLPANLISGEHFMTATFPKASFDSSAVVAENPMKAAILTKDIERLKGLVRVQHDMPGQDMDTVLSVLDFSEAERLELGRNPMWLSQVYLLLAADEGDKASDQWLANDRSLESVGRVFENILLAGLPSQVREFRTIRALPMVSSDELRDLLKLPDVTAATETGILLAEHGLTPNTFQLATEAVSTLVDELRADRRLEFSSARPLRLRLDSELARAKNELSFRELAVDIAHIADLDLAEAGREPYGKYENIGEVPLPRSSAVLTWLLEVSVCKSQIFRNLEADSRDPNGDILFRPVTSPSNLADRWAIGAYKTECHVQAPEVAAAMT